MAVAGEDYQIEMHRSPPLGAVAIVFALLYGASIGVGFYISQGASYPNPLGSIELSRDYYTQFPDAVRVASFLEFGASIPLGIFAAAVVSRLFFLGIRVAGVHIALFGGFASAFLLAVSALCTWGLSQPGLAMETGAVRLAEFMTFALGAIGHTTTVGLFIAGTSVPCLVYGFLPRWICWLGLLIAAICLASSFSMLYPVVALVIQGARGAAYLWLVAAGFMMPNTRRVAVDR